MLVPNVLPRPIIQNAVREIAAFVEANLEDSSTWYRNAPENDGIVPLHHAQSLWDIRQCPNLHDVFREFWGTRRLMVDINRCIFRPPCHRDWPDLSRGDIHWDTDPRLDDLGTLQSVVLLTDGDTSRGQGGRCYFMVHQVAARQRC
jgi:hypothetical protein